MFENFGSSKLWLFGVFGGTGIILVHKCHHSHKYKYRGYLRFVNTIHIILAYNLIVHVTPIYIPVRSAGGGLSYNLIVHVTPIYIPVRSAGGGLVYRATGTLPANCFPLSAFHFHSFDYKMPFIPINAPTCGAVSPLSSITSPHGLPGTV